MQSQTHTESQCKHSQTDFCLRYSIVRQALRTESNDVFTTTDLLLIMDRLVDWLTNQRHDLEKKEWKGGKSSHSKSYFLFARGSHFQHIPPVRSTSTLGRWRLPLACFTNIYFYTFCAFLSSWLSWKAFGSFCSVTLIYIYLRGFSFLFCSAGLVIRRFAYWEIYFMACTWGLSRFC